MPHATLNRRKSDIKAGEFLLDGGQMGATIRKLDWAKTDLGQPDQWPQNLKTAVQDMLRSPYPMFVAWGPTLTLLYNNAFMSLLGHHRPRAIGRPMNELWGKDWEFIAPQVQSVIKDRQSIWKEETNFAIDQNGLLTERYFSYSLRPLSDDPATIPGVIGISTDDTSRVLTRRRFRILRELNEESAVRNKTVAEMSSHLINVIAKNSHDIPFCLLYLFEKNRKNVQLSGVAGLAEDHLACPATVHVHSANEGNYPWPFASVAESKRPSVISDLIERCGRLSGGPWPDAPHTAVALPIFASSTSIEGFFVAGISPRLAYDNDYTGYLELLTQAVSRGITYARDYEDEKASADKPPANKDAQLHQASKLEAVGRLAGGVAHDFNNLITGIIGISEDIKARHSQDLATVLDLDLIIGASKRAFAVTKQLLAFARRQVIQPIVLDVNLTIMEANRLIQQLLGEDIKIQLELSKVNRIKMDRGHFDQVLLNLAVNARDAMPDGGTLTIRTNNTELTTSQITKGQFDIPPGHYVMLEVRDNGAGMDANTLTHIFEPFFTTKDRDKGSGLGLSMVYGIVKQSGGDIKVKTKPGGGTSFTIYLPTTTDERMPKDSLVPEELPALGHETILVVEDEDIVRRVVVKKLKQHGYKILEATNGKLAHELVQHYKGPINLLLTDVVMPEMNGRELAHRIRETHPEAAVLFMSGYPENVIAHRGILEPGIAFIEKAEASGTGLLEKVREVLDKHHEAI